MWNRVKIIPVIICLLCILCQDAYDTASDIIKCIFRITTIIIIIGTSSSSSSSLSSSSSSSSDSSLKSSFRHISITLTISPLGHHHHYIIAIDVGVTIFTSIPTPAALKITRCLLSVAITYWLAVIAYIKKHNNHNFHLSNRHKNHYWHGQLQHK